MIKDSKKDKALEEVMVTQMSTKEEKEETDLCLVNISTLAFLGMLISLILFGFGFLSVNQSSKWVFAMFVVFVVDQLFVEPLFLYIKKKGV